MSLLMRMLTVGVQICIPLFMLLASNLFLPRVLQVYVLDVGQGDAVLITTAGNKHILIDGGPEQNVLAPLSRYLPPFDHQIDLIIVTHPHADHIDGLLAVLTNYNVGGILFSDVAYTSTNYARLIANARQKGVLLFQARADEDWLLEQGVFVDILFPFSSLQGLNFRNVNNSSLVFKLSTGAETTLFTGDMEKELERILLHFYKYSLAATYLKVAHHGSKTSSTLPFLSIVKPLEMWVSVGMNNSYGHPDEATYERLSSLGKVFRTDKVGTITKSLVQ